MKTRPNSPKVCRLFNLVYLLRVSIRHSQSLRCHIHELAALIKATIKMV